MSAGTVSYLDGHRTKVVESRTLKGIRFSMLCAFECSRGSFSKWRKASQCIDWSDEAGSFGPPLLDYQTAERFLLGKQLFFGTRHPIPSFPPIRGYCHQPLRLAIRLSRRRLDLTFWIVVSFFAKQNVITVLAFTELSEITVDELIFLKQAKWYTADEHEPCMVLVRDDTREGEVPVRSYWLALNDFICGLGAKGIKNHDWPIFDFIEIRDFGPSIGRGPNIESRLTLNEHWGLLCGDEGFRLIDEDEDGYKSYLLDESNRFRGRVVFLYNFHHTSCLAFRSKDEENVRARWRDFYVDNMGYIPMLARYIGFSPKIPGLTDGIPLLVEICLLRYVELYRIDTDIQSEEKKSIIGFLWTRLRGMTSLERAVALLQRLDLYQESSLWIVGGAYTGKLFGYAQIRERVDRTIMHNQAASADIRVFYLTFLTLFAGIIGALAAVVAIAK